MSTICVSTKRSGCLESEPTMSGRRTRESSPRSCLCTRHRMSHMSREREREREIYIYIRGIFMFAKKKLLKELLDQTAVGSA